MTSTAQIRVVLVDDIQTTLARLSRATQELSESAPAVPVVLMSVQEDRDYLRRAIQAGVPVANIRRVTAPRTMPAPAGASREPFAPPAVAEPGHVDPAVFVEAPSEKNERKAVHEQPSREPESPDYGGATRVIAVFSGKGGVGKTLLAINIAAALADGKHADVALMDLDLQFGDVAVLMGVEPPATLYDVARAYPDIDATKLVAMMPEVAGSVSVLASPMSPELADLITPEHVGAVIGLLREAFDHVVLDCGSHLDDRVLEALERADQIVLVTDLDLPAIKDAKLALRLFESLKIPRDHIKLVINRADAPAITTIEQIEKNLGLAVAVQIPSQGKHVLKSLHDEIPIVIQAPKAHISLKIGELVSALVPLPETAKGRSSRKGSWPRPGGS